MLRGSLYAAFIIVGSYQTGEKAVKKSNVITSLFGLILIIPVTGSFAQDPLTLVTRDSLLKFTISSSFALAHNRESLYYMAIGAILMTAYLAASVIFALALAKTASDADTQICPECAE
jgi:hypothetical protein